MKIQWRLTGLYILLNGLSLLLFWLGIRTLSGPVLRVDFMTAFLAIVLPGGLVYALALQLAKRIDRIYSAAESIARGEFEEVNLPDDSDELGRLSSELMRLAQQIKVSIQKSTQEAQKIQAILTGMQEGVVALDQVGRVVLVNAAAEKMFRCSLEEVRGKYLLELCPFEELERLIAEAVERNSAGSTELVLEKQILRAQVSPVLNENGRPRGAVIVCYDVTELRRLEQIRTEFVGNVSHELRTPLTSIKGFVETLLDGAAESPIVRERFLKIIQTETLRLQRLIDDLLTLAHIENRENRRAESAKFCLVQEAYEKIKPVIQSYAEAKGLKLEVKLPEDLPPVSMGSDLLSQVLLNLLENAVKYTQEGQVWLYAWAQEDFVRLEFGDTGCGIPEQDLPRIFERFYRVDKARSREQGGTGLGLSIVKHIVEGSGGKIEVRSQVGVGTVFTCDLPKAGGQK